MSSKKATKILQGTDARREIVISARTIEGIEALKVIRGTVDGE